MLRRYCVWIIVCLCYFSLSVTSSFATTDLGLVKAHAQGFAITATYLGLESSLKNPAGIYTKSKLEGILNINDTYAMDIYNGFSGIKFTSNNTSSIALSMPFSYINNINKTQLDSNGIASKIDSFTSLSLSPRITYSTQLSSLTHVGVSAIYLYDQIDTESAHGFSFDLGLIHTFKSMQFGFSIQNLLHNKYWSTQKKETKSLQYNMGLNYKVLNNLEILSDISIIESDTLINLGSHIMLTSQLDVYLGCFDLGQTNQLRSGVQLSIDSTTVSYSYSHHNTLGDSHKIGMEIEF